MKDDRESTLDELVRAVALARLCFDEKVTIQVPPNLTPGEEVEDGWRALLNAGINDWGGISPGVTPDFVSPECEWPALKTLSAVCREEGRSLVPRLAAHPRFIGEKMNAWIDEEVAPHVRVLSDAGGFGRGHALVPRERGTCVGNVQRRRRWDICYKFGFCERRSGTW